MYFFIYIYSTEFRVILPGHFLCNMFNNYSEIPLEKLIDSGVIVTVNSDNMTVSGTNARKDMQHLIESHNLSKEQVRELILNSVSASFLSKEEKVELKKMVEGCF